MKTSGALNRNSKNRINKIKSLLNDMSMSERLLHVGCEESFITLLSTDVDYCQAHEYINNKKSEAIEFLTKA